MVLKREEIIHPEKRLRLFSATRRLLLMYVYLHHFDQFSSERLRFFSIISHHRETETKLFLFLEKNALTAKEEKGAAIFRQPYKIGQRKQGWRNASLRRGIKRIYDLMCNIQSAWTALLTFRTTPCSTCRGSSWSECTESNHLIAGVPSGGRDLNILL